MSEDKDIWADIPYTVPLEEADKDVQKRVMRESTQAEAKSIEHSILINDFFYTNLSKLPPKLSDVITLHDINGFTLKEISEQLDLSLDTIKKRHQRAREQFRIEMEKDVETLQDIGIDVHREATSRIGEIMNNVKQLRELTGLTQEDFAWRVGTTRGYLAQIETGRRKPNKELMTKLQENVLVALVYQQRLEMPIKKRIDEAFELYQQLRRVLRVDVLCRTRMLVVSMYDPDEIPVVMNGVFALSVYHKETGFIDLILLDGYELKNVIDARLKNKSAEPTKEAKVFKHVLTDDECWRRGVECPLCHSIKTPKKLLEAKNLLDTKWRCVECGHEFPTREAWHIN